MRYLFLMALATAMVIGGCADSSSSSDGGTTDSDADTDSDTNTDTDTGTDTDDCVDGATSVGTSGTTWVSICGGSFQMGFSWYSDAQPIHEVTVPSFEMLKTEVTAMQYGECVTAGGCTAPNTPPSCNWPETGYEDHPMNCVTWQQSVDFCAWVGGRLPSESEWEYAARSGGQDIIYPWGDEDATCDFAVMDDGEYGCGTEHTWAVCVKTEGNTDQGLCDMAGNVWEWVQDWYHSNYTGAPTDGSAWEDPIDTDRVCRGGSYGSVYYALCAATRNGSTPSNPHLNIGFRCVR